MNRRIWVCLGVVALLLSSACGPKVMIPPEVDLRKYEQVGLIGFTCNAEGNLHEFVTERFLRAIRKSQKEAQIIELGSQEEVLRSVQGERIDQETIRAIAQSRNVDAVITGNVEIAKVKPMVELYTKYTPTSVTTPVEGTRVPAALEVSISARLWETQNGAAIWTASARGEGMINEVSVLSGREVLFDAKDPREAYWDLVKPLVKQISTDYKVRYKKTK